ncbi:pterin-4-alpha-carbinolamine dehydratase [Photobacterium aphoticum]|uniref:Putative pterin-4-alpha-carbinolamine dehydratase n=1 Tax=Photobacterium aphoticum TaxID=754436 RepID=A0A090QJM5_9GAMM|nr:pterin-4-alpha-carbinolamine dehydratase [Photobacterium aphoticum]
MTALNELRCEACHSGAPTVTEAERNALMAELSDWTVIEREGIAQLERCFVFKNFKLAWALTDKVAALAEAEGHHPEITLEWGKVTVRWWSHSAKGLHKNDFICAAKTDALLAE